MASSITTQQAESRWHQMADAVRERWVKLTAEDVADVRGNADRLIDTLRRRYGVPRGEAVRQLNAWSRSLRQAPGRG